MLVDGDRAAVAYTHDGRGRRPPDRRSGACSASGSATAWSPTASTTGTVPTSSARSASLERMAPEVLPYGSWPTPITAARVIEAAVRLGGLRADGDDLWWLELRPQEGGRTALVRRRADGTVDDLLPAPWNVRTAVHEYGGGAAWFRDGVAWFTNWADQRLYRLEPGIGAGGRSRPSRPCRAACATPTATSAPTAPPSPASASATRPTAPSSTRSCCCRSAGGDGHGDRHRARLRVEPPLAARRRRPVLDRVGPPEHAVGRHPPRSPASAARTCWSPAGPRSRCCSRSGSRAAPCCSCRTAAAGGTSTAGGRPTRSSRSSASTPRSASPSGCSAGPGTPCAADDSHRLRLLARRLRPPRHRRPERRRAATSTCRTASGRTSPSSAPRCTPSPPHRPRRRRWWPSTCPPRAVDRPAPAAGARARSRLPAAGRADRLPDHRRPHRPRPRLRPGQPRLRRARRASGRRSSRSSTAARRRRPARRWPSTSASGPAVASPWST